MRPRRCTHRRASGFGAERRRRRQIVDQARDARTQPDDRCDEPARGDIRFGFGNADRELRNRHADISRNAFGRRPQRSARPIGVVACLPKAGALLRLDCPGERILGTVIYFVLREFLADLASAYLIILGVVAIGVMLKAPKGIWGYRRPVRLAALSACPPACARCVLAHKARSRTWLSDRGPIGPDWLRHTLALWWGRFLASFVPGK